MKIEVEKSNKPTLFTIRDCKPGDLVSSVEYGMPYLILDNGNFLGLDSSEKLRLFNVYHGNFEVVKLPPGSKVVLTVE